MTTVTKGDELGPLEVTVTRENLVRYAGASLDFNPIHWNERFAKEVGLPDVIAHGMLTMALAGRLVTDWAGDPGKVLEYGVRFTRPVPVPDDGSGATVTFTGKVSEVSEGVAKVLITAKCQGQTVLGKAVAKVAVD
ncbi:MaoC family dehydratase [Sciscionella sediminilitoris]|uniref:MaoC family dehydratase n=1 Tax=Sciscionella sediminilitoris TaxID=1445613 RepID=UPI0004DF4327|nr:MaoC family dehydratase [Sciscionella sp. SE31]